MVIGQKTDEPDPGLTWQEGCPGGRAFSLASLNNVYWSSKANFSDLCTMTDSHPDLRDTPLQQDLGRQPLHYLSLISISSNATNPPHASPKTSLPLFLTWTVSFRWKDKLVLWRLWSKGPVLSTEPMLRARRLWSLGSGTRILRLRACRQQRLRLVGSGRILPRLPNPSPSPPRPSLARASPLKLRPSLPNTTSHAPRCVDDQVLSLCLIPRRQSDSQPSGHLIISRNKTKVQDSTDDAVRGSAN
ncbi:hypothetical protein RRG08_027763 [Elysia crispata]|uniref:Uncharacterized protein n=1 Tax=Elysia crispata TaxID=231223 RepID=A0AAE1DC90_9GAST|nr:hypothetical protein RRG08_027763 [Elysia crispata]